MNLNDLETPEEEKVYQAAFNEAPVGKENEAAEMAVMQFRAKKQKGSKKSNMFEERRKLIDSLY